MLLIIVGVLLVLWLLGFLVLPTAAGGAVHVLVVVALVLVAIKLFQDIKWR